jgi:hypothetical protein
LPRRESAKPDQDNLREISQIAPSHDRVRKIAIPLFLSIHNYLKSQTIPPKTKKAAGRGHPSGGSHQNEFWIFGNWLIKVGASMSRQIGRDKYGRNRPGRQAPQKKIVMRLKNLLTVETGGVIVLPNSGKHPAQRQPRRMAELKED